MRQSPVRGKKKTHKIQYKDLQCDNIWLIYNFNHGNFPEFYCQFCTEQINISEKYKSRNSVEINTIMYIPRSSGDIFYLWIK